MPAAPQMPPRVIVGDASLSGLEPNAVADLVIPLHANGVLDVTVDWTFASNNVDLYLVRDFVRPRKAD